MESKHNPFESRYPNRYQIISMRDDMAKKLIKEQIEKSYSKNVISLNEDNKKLNLYSTNDDPGKPFDDSKFPSKFKDYGKIPEIIKKNLENLGFSELTSIQKLTFAYLFNYKGKFFDEKNYNNNNYDIVGCAQTGSGKTLAYLIPTVSFLFNDPEGIPKIKNNKNTFGYVSYPLILIILPTRELAIQTYQECLKLLYKTYINTVCIYGGESYQYQMEELKDGCDIIVGTTGRLIDFLSRKLIDFSYTKFVIIDEADKLLDMGFEEDINHIIFDHDFAENCSTFLFSATFCKRVSEMVNKVMRDGYAYITHGRFLGEGDETNRNVKQRFYYINFKNEREIFEKKLNALYGLLKLLDGKTLIFVNKKADVEALCLTLDQDGYGVVGLHGDMDMYKRKWSLDNFKNGDVNLMIASDVASRGLDIPDIKYVVNFDMPNNIDIYVHRIGRTGRVGNKGSSFTFLTRMDSYLFKDIFGLLQKTGQKIPDFIR